MAAGRRVLLGCVVAAATVMTGLLAIANVAGVAEAQEVVTVTLGPGRDGSQTGTALLTAEGDRTEITIEIEPGPQGVAQPAHIHEGSCPEVGAVKFPLRDVIDGESATEVTVPLADLQNGNLSINVHKSNEEVGVYVACGNIPTAAVAPAVSGPSAPTAGAPVSGTGGLLADSGGAGMVTWWYMLAGGGALLTAAGLLGRRGARPPTYARRAAIATAAAPAARLSARPTAHRWKGEREGDRALSLWWYGLMASGVLFTVGLLALRKGSGPGAGQSTQV